MNFTSGDLWFLATRSAFGIRPDGNLVFAVGHHIGTMDLAKALALAGCVRGIHGDANPGNCFGRHLPPRRHRKNSGQNQIVACSE